MTQEIKTGLIFESYNFQMIAEVLAIDVSKDILIVRLTSRDKKHSWVEDWNLEHTHWGFERGEYYIPKDQEPVKADTYLSEMRTLLAFIVESEEIKFMAGKSAADWVNNNTPNIGQTIDYKSYPALPEWVELAKLLLEKTKPPS